MLTLYDARFASRLLLGTAQYPSPDTLKRAVEAARAEIVTVSVRRESARARTGQGFWQLIEQLGCRVLPNTAGCRTAKEAVSTARMARELFGTPWIKLEVIANDDTLQPDLFSLVEAANILCAEGFEVLPYTTEDLSAAERLVAAGCTVLMPWAAPIGSARGLINKTGLKTLRAYFPGVTLIVDAGIGDHGLGHVELLGQPGVDSNLLQVRQVRRRGAESGLLQETRRTQVRRAKTRPGIWRSDDACGHGCARPRTRHARCFNADARGVRCNRGRGIEARRGDGTHCRAAARDSVDAPGNAGIRRVGHAGREKLGRRRGDRHIAGRDTHCYRRRGRRLNRYGSDADCSRVGRADGLHRDGRRARYRGRCGI